MDQQQRIDENAFLFLQDLLAGTRTEEGLQSVADRMEESQTADQLANSTNYQAIKVALDMYNA